MYLEEIYLENTGPISKCRVELPFDADGNPLPVVIVGPNGSGKSIFLSYVVDALTEFAKQAFHNIVPSDGLSSPYLRVISRVAIRSGQPFSLSLLRFKANKDDLYYCEKSGTLDSTAYSPDVKSVFTPVWSWAKDENHKKVLSNEKTIKEEMRKGVYAFFPAGRREQPDWLNPESLKVGMRASINRRSNDELDKPIWVETCAEENISWILDVFLDSLIDLQPQFQKWEGRDFIFREISSSEFQELKNSILLRQGRQNVESILREILQDETLELILNYRNIGASRISIKMSNGRTLHALQSLSEGQSQLFHLFATVIRYGEHADINMSFRLPDITGLVVIDEIDAHLHPTLQYSVVPKLMKLFPKVQFIVSSHSPLFLLGMEKEFGPDGLAIFELPDGDRIYSEQFSEFENAFGCYQDTERFKKERRRREEAINQLLADMTKPVVLTEGKTDAQYIQTALKLLEEEDLLNALEIKPVSNDMGKEFLPGGSSGLDTFHKTYVTHPAQSHHPILLLYDCDTKVKPNEIEKLWVRKIPVNSENMEVTQGIENLFSNTFFTEVNECYYDIKVEKKDDGSKITIEKPNKLKFCKWICENGSAADFDGFTEVIEILKEFIKTHQSPLSQQPTSE